MFCCYDVDVIVVVHVYFVVAFVHVDVVVAVDVAVGVYVVVDPSTLNLTHKFFFLPTTPTTTLTPDTHKVGGREWGSTHLK